MAYKIPAGEICASCSFSGQLLAGGIKHWYAAVFDSLSDTIPMMVQSQTACLVSTKEDNIEVDVQMQVSTNYIAKSMHRGGWCRHLPLHATPCISYLLIFFAG